MPAWGHPDLVQPRCPYAVFIGHLSCQPISATTCFVASGIIEELFGAQRKCRTIACEHEFRGHVFFNRSNTTSVTLGVHIRNRIQHKVTQKHECMKQNECEITHLPRLICHLQPYGLSYGYPKKLVSVTPTGPAGSVITI